MSRSMMDAYSKAIYDNWVREAVLAAFIQLPWEHELRFLVGHNPQLLLAPPDRKRTFHERMRVWEEGGDLEAHGIRTSLSGVIYGIEDQIHDGLDEMIDLARPRVSTFQTDPWQMFDKGTLDRLMGISYDDMVKMMFPTSVLMDDETINFEPTTRDYTVLLVADDGQVVAEQTKREEINRKLAPFIAPIGRLVYETNIPPRQEGKTLQTRFHMSSDWSEIEMRVLLATLQHETADRVVLDFSRHGGEIAGAYSLMGQSAGQFSDALHTFSRAAAKSKRLPKQPDYLKHDKTKNHRRPRR